MYQRLVNKRFFQQIEQNVEVHVDDMLVKSKEEEHYLNGLKETFKALCLMVWSLIPTNVCLSLRKFLGFMVSQQHVKANLDKIQAILEMSPPKNVKEI